MADENSDKPVGTVNSGRSRSLVERAAGKILLTPAGSLPESAKPAAAPAAADAKRVEATEISGLQNTSRQAIEDTNDSTPLDQQRQRQDGNQAIVGGTKRTSKLAHIDLAKLVSQDILTPQRKRSRLGEELRLIKRKVLGRSRESGNAIGNTVMITSALPAEGKTTISINLAMSIAAEEDRRVLLVDADFVKPDVLNRLGVSADKGLIDVIEDPRLDIADVMLRTDIDKLSLIPSGKLHDRCTELLASVRMRELVAELSSRYEDRILIFDSPPVLATTESVALASHMGQIVFVVQAERTRRRQVESALDLLGDPERVGLVLNRLTPKMGGVEFGYYYDTYYYQHSGEPKPSAQRPASP